MECMRNNRSFFVMVSFIFFALAVLTGCKTGESLDAGESVSAYSGYTSDYYQEPSADEPYAVSDDEAATREEGESSFLPVIEDASDVPAETAGEAEEEPVSLKSLLSGETAPVPVMVDRSASEPSDGLSIVSGEEEEGFDMLREYMKSIEQSRPVTEPVSVINPAFINHDAEPETSASPLPVPAEAASESKQEEEETTSFIYVPEPENTAVTEKHISPAVPEEPVMQEKTEDEQASAVTETADASTASTSPIDFFAAGKNFWSSNYSSESFRAQDEARNQAEKVITDETVTEEPAPAESMPSVLPADLEEDNTEPYYEDPDSRVAAEAAARDRETLKNMNFTLFITSWEGISCIAVLVIFVGLLAVIRVRRKKR